MLQFATQQYNEYTAKNLPRRIEDKRRIVLLDKTREGNRYKTRQAKTRVSVLLVYGKGSV